MTDTGGAAKITPEQIQTAWDEYSEAATATGSTENGAIDLYDIDGMNDAAYALWQLAIALAARTEEKTHD